jgi:hypothetical protein
MAAGFGDTTRALAADRARGGPLVAIAVALLVGG